MVPCSNVPVSFGVLFMFVLPIEVVLLGFASFSFSHPLEVVILPGLIFFPLLTPLEAVISLGQRISLLTPLEAVILSSFKTFFLYSPPLRQ
jgi:hypothetical protein